MFYSITNTLAITLLGVTITVFIFTVTLLGNAIGKAKREEKETKEQEGRNFDIKINDMQNKINSARETGDIGELDNKLKELKQAKKKANKQIQQIQRKYSLLGFKKSILFPGISFVLTIMLNEFARLYEKYSVVSLSFWILSIICLGTGIYRICRCLILVEEISMSSEEFEIKKLSEAFKVGLELHESKKKENLEIKFVGIQFPHTCEKILN